MKPVQEPQRHWRTFFFIYGMAEMQVQEPQVQEPQVQAPKITSDVPKTKPAKNPGRVVVGKRLAEHNRLVREAKKKTSQG